MSLLIRSHHFLFQQVDSKHNKKCVSLLSDDSKHNKKCVSLLSACWKKMVVKANQTEPNRASNRGDLLISAVDDAWHQPKQAGPNRGPNQANS